MTFPATLATTSLNGANGFNIVSSSMGFGWSVAGAGDVNGDGKSDLIIGGSDPWSPSNTSYVVFGNSHFLSTFNTSALNGTNGFVLTSSSIYFGYSVAGAGDINGDGKDDLIIGAGYSGVSAAYVVFGSSRFTSVLDTSALTGINGFKLTSSLQTFGQSVASAGDINGDGKDDLIVGQYAYGQAYVIFGASSFPSTLDTLALTEVNGFKLTSSSIGFGYSFAAAGDINGDGKDDLIIGTADSNPNAAYAIFGASSFPSILDTSTLNGTNGFNINLGSSLSSASSVAGAGDINGDGKADLVIGTYNNINTAYVIFGANSFQSTFNTSSLNGTNGFNITASSHNIQFVYGIGYSVDGAGDVNCDGKSDLIIGAVNPSVAYVIFGGNSFSSTLDISTLNGTNGFNITSSTAGTIEVAGAGDINRDGKSDILIGAYYSNASYVIYGRSPTPTAVPNPTSAPLPLSVPESVLVPVGVPVSVPVGVPVGVPVAVFVPQTVLFTNISITIGGNFNGTAGNDRFNIDVTSNVIISTGGGMDEFVIHSNPGVNISITDFNNTINIIDLSNFTQISSFSKLIITQGSAIVNLPESQKVIVQNLNPSDLAADNFIFADTSPVLMPDSSNDSLSSTEQGLIAGVVVAGVGSLLAVVACCGCVIAKMTSIWPFNNPKQPAFDPISDNHATHPSPPQPQDRDSHHSVGAGGSLFLGGGGAGGSSMHTVAVDAKRHFTTGAGDAGAGDSPAQQIYSSILSPTVSRYALAHVEPTEGMWQHTEMQDAHTLAGACRDAHAAD